MKIREVKVTPQMAREWLAVDGGRERRTVRKRNLARLTAALDNGEWMLTHQPIALGPDGFVLDGVHRLTAIANQRKHVLCHVAYDVDPDTYTVIDIGAARSPADSLKVAGYTDVAVLAATTRIVIAYPATIGSANTLSAVTTGITTTEILATIEDPETGKAIRDSLPPGTRAANGIGRNGYRSSCCALLALIALYSSHGTDTQAEFTTRLTDGANLPSDSPILGFRRWIINDTGYVRQPGWVRQTAALALGIRTWNDYANGRERTKLGYRAAMDRMPEID